MNEALTRNYEEAPLRDAEQWSFYIDPADRVNINEIIKQTQNAPSIAPIAEVVTSVASEQSTNSRKDNGLNSSLADEILAFMTTPDTSAPKTKAVAEKPVKAEPNVTFAEVVGDYLASPASKEYLTENVDYSAAIANRAKKEAYAAAVATNRRIMPSFFDPKLEAPVVVPVIETPSVKPVAEVLVVEPAVIVEQPAEEEIDDFMVWKNLGHIKEAEPLTTLELKALEEDDKLLRQTDTVVAARGLTKLLTADKEAFLAKTSPETTVIPEAEVQTISNTNSDEVQAETEESDDFDDWNGVLKANQLENRNNREFWAETEALSDRFARYKRLGKQALAAAAVAVIAVPAIGAAISKISGASVFKNKGAIVRSFDVGLSANAAGRSDIPAFEFSTTSTTAVVEKGVATITDTTPVAAIDLSMIALQAKEKADADDALKAKEAAEAAAAEAAAAQAEAERRKTLVLALGELCGSAAITSPQGLRVHPLSGTVKMHTGIDLGCENGSPIHAAKSGTVTLAGWNGGYGNTVVIDHGNGETTLYAHQSSLNVSVGSEVEAGQVIGKVGSTGDSTGPHLHFEKRVNGEPVDPTA